MLLWTNHVTEQHFDIIETLKKTGYDGIELFLGSGDEAHYSKLGNFFSKMDMGVTAVAALEPEENIASPDKKYREAGLDKLKWSIDMTAAANGEVICGPFHSTFAFFTRQPPTSEERSRSAEVLRKAAEYAEKANIILAPEAVNRFECYLYNTMADLKTLVEKVDHPNFGAMYDTHHSNIEEKSQEGAIKTIAPCLKHVHISENDRGTPAVAKWIGSLPSRAFATLVTTAGLPLRPLVPLFPNLPTPSMCGATIRRPRKYIQRA